MQLCYDVCPIGKYADTVNKRCLICFNCTSINDCAECYSNGCNPTKFFDITKNPYECSLCNLTKAGCYTCFSNQTGGPYCTKCY